MNDSYEKITHELATLFDAFYSRFVLRDLFGKVIPGAFFLIMISFTIIESDNAFKFYDYLTNIWVWIIFIGISWLIGFAIQGFGEKLNLIRYFPDFADKKGKSGWMKYKWINKYFPEYAKSEFTKEIWYKLYIFFRENSSKPQRDNVERLVVIKEACGNGYIALFFSLILMIVSVLLNVVVSGNSIFSIFIEKQGVLFIPIIFFTIIFIVYLRKMHFIQVQNQWDYMNNLMEYNLKYGKIKDKLPSKITKK